MTSVPWTLLICSLILTTDFPHSGQENLFDVPRWTLSTWTWRSQALKKIFPQSSQICFFPCWCVTCKCEGRFLSHSWQIWHCCFSPRWTPFKCFTAAVFDLKNAWQSGCSHEILVILSACLCFKWLFMFFTSFPQSSQVVVVFPPWMVSMCVSRATLQLNPFSHILHMFSNVLFLLQVCLW